MKYTSIFLLTCIVFLIGCSKVVEDSGVKTVGASDSKPQVSGDIQQEPERSAYNDPDNPIMVEVEGRSYQIDLTTKYTIQPGELYFRDLLSGERFLIMGKPYIVKLGKTATLGS